MYCKPSLHRQYGTSRNIYYKAFVKSTEPHILFCQELDFEEFYTQVRIVGLICCDVDNRGP